MSAFAISDLHTETGLRSEDTSAGADAALIRLSHDLAILHARLWGLGDWFELHQLLASIAARNPASALDLIFHAHPGFEAVWSHVEFCCIGNHEAPFIKPGFKYRGVEFVENAVVNGVWCEHGHAHDELVARCSTLCRKVSNAVGWAERHWHPDVDRWGEATWHWLTRTGRHGGNEKYWEPVAEVARHHDCTKAVFGHTHCLATHHDGGAFRTWESTDMGHVVHCWGFSPVDVYNTGSWVGENMDVTRIEGC